MSSVRRNGAIQAYEVDKNSLCAREIFFMYMYNEKDDFYKSVDQGNNFLQLYVFIIP